MCAFAQTSARGTIPNARSRHPFALGAAFRRDSSRKISAARRTPASVSGRMFERLRERSAHQTSITIGATPVAPMRRAASPASPNATSVVIQRHANKPCTPAHSHTGQMSTRKIQDGSTSGAPCVGQVQSCVEGIECVCQMTLPTSRCCQMSGSWIA
jgi:hypothetical protein